MKIAALSYPMFTQQLGGLEIQIRETLAALQSIGCDIRLIDPVTEKLADFDLIHVFAAGSGNFRIVQFAQMVHRPVVMSPLLRDHWTKSLGRRARWGDLWFRRLTRWEVSTEYRDLQIGLSGSAKLLALGERERQCIVDGFRIGAERIEVVPNGIPPRFFEGDASLACRHFGLEQGFVLCVASIDEHKNQLGLAQALQDIGRPVVLVGECSASNRAYLDQVLTVPGTRYLGRLSYDDPLLASVYAASGVFALTSRSEVMPLTALEALAAGTPVVMTRNHGMDTSALRHVLSEVDPSAAGEIRLAVEQKLRDGPDRATCSDSVRHLTWEAVARQLLLIYHSVMQKQQASG